MILETERLYLRYLEEADALRMSEYRSKPEVAQYQSWTSVIHKMMPNVVFNNVS